MEAQQQNPQYDHLQQAPPTRQSSSRWTPTTDQIRILKELYYNNGLRSPSAEQIQRISARLRQYGKIEGKNVFYWFQNHKARERQKKKFTTDLNHMPIMPSSFHRNNTTTAASTAWRSSEDNYVVHNNYPPNYNTTPGFVPTCPSHSSPAGVHSAVGQIGSYGHGSVAMEKSFRKCSISPKNSNGSGSKGRKIGGWIGDRDPYSSVACAYPFLGHTKAMDDDETLEEDEDGHKSPAEIETLPLFPMRDEDDSSGFYNIKPPKSSTGYYTNTNSISGWCQSDLSDSSYGGSSLELTLNSYITGSRSTDFY